jgi:hypothetical protein
MFDFLSMAEDFDEVCNRLFGYNPSTQGSRADAEVKELEEDVQHLDDLIDRANPGAKEKMAKIRRNAAIDLILASHDEALRLNLALASAIGTSSSVNHDEAINQLKRATIRELIGQILDLKVAYCSLEEEMKATSQNLADSMKLTSLSIRNSQELSEKLFEAKKRLADHDVLSAKLVTFQGELRSRGLTTKMAVEDLLLALARVTWPLHDDSNGKFLQPNDDCQHPCCYVHVGGMANEGPQEPPADATEAPAKVEEVVSEAVATEPAEVAVPSPAPKPARARKTRIVTLTEKSTTRKAREKKAPAQKSSKGSNPPITEKPKQRRRGVEGGWPPEDVW